MKPLRALFLLLAVQLALVATAHARPGIVPANPHPERANDTRATFGEAAAPSETLPGKQPMLPVDAPTPKAPVVQDPTHAGFAPVHIATRRSVAVARYVPMAPPRRGPLASRSGRPLPQRFKLVYERQAVTMDIAPIILKYAKQHRLDPHLIKAVISVESNFNNFAVSWAGASGLMQLMPATGYSMGARDLFDPEQNIAAGSRYLRAMLDRYKGRLDLAIAAYNAGPGNVYNAIPNISETQRYVVKVMKAYNTYKATSN